jgi:hypothetical protein
MRKRRRKSEKEREKREKGRRITFSSSQDLTVRQSICLILHGNERMFSGITVSVCGSSKLISRALVLICKLGRGNRGEGGRGRGGRGKAYREEGERGERREGSGSFI